MMYLIFYVSLLLLLVPIQVTLLAHVGPWGIRPDLCLVATCLIGFLGGKQKGCISGIGIGFVQDLFSGGAGIVNLFTKGLVGFLSGVIAKTLSNTTAQAIFLPTFLFSCASSLIALFSARPQTDWFLMLHETRTILLPQALFDALLAFGVYWVLSKLDLVDPGVEPTSLR
ncbi:MAG: rod shape-determining protein MreD [Nitrospirales bacterium]|nr:rod shape-determining protein MreD [Nitrospira sp.]MDR4501038.1 rod shape-determining protein MreD [Nitrospirales bacterium]